MEAAGYQMPSQNAATDFLEKILSRKCKIHKMLPCEYIHLKPTEFSPRLCCECMEVRKIPFNEAISIRLLLQATSDTTFNAYPKFADNSITQKIQDLKGSKDRISTEFSSFFRQLNSTVSQAIEQVRYQQKQKLSSLSNSYYEVFDSLGNISQIVQFQELVKNENENEDELRAFIQQQNSEVNKQTEMMNNKLVEYQQVEESFSLLEANNRLQQIKQLIEGITLFSIYDKYDSLREQVKNKLELKQKQQQVQQQFCDCLLRGYCSESSTMNDALQLILLKVEGQLSYYCWSKTTRGRSCSSNSDISGIDIVRLDCDCFVRSYTKAATL